MIWPLSETLTHIEAHLPGQLVSPKTFSHVQTIADLLPNAMSGHYFETRLAANVTEVDFSTCVIAVEGGREILAGQSPTVDLPPLLLDNPLWRRVRQFSRAWADPTSPLFQQVPLIWLEFDKVDGARSIVPLPGVNICLDPRYLEDHPRPGNLHRSSTQNLDSLIDAAIEGPLGHTISARTRRNLLTCFEVLPAGGKIIYLSIMLPRQPATLKLNGFVPKDQLLDYLGRIGWTGSIDEIEKIIATYCDSLDSLRVDLTVGDRISSRLGIEFFSKGSSQSDSERNNLLNLFVQRGLCAPDKRDGLLAWFGFSTETFNYHSWPTKLNRTWYTKLVYQINQSLEAKGYLGFMPTLFSLF